MSCINLPTVLPGSPSKTRGQIQVRAPGRGASTGGRGGVGVVAGRPCAVDSEVTPLSFLGDSRTHVLRKKVIASRGRGEQGPPAPPSLHPEGLSLPGASCGPDPVPDSLPGTAARVSCRRATALSRPGCGSAQFRPAHEGPMTARSFAQPG